jgi:hypothetical protein
VKKPLWYNLPVKSSVCKGKNNAQTDLSTKNQTPRPRSWIPPAHGKRGWPNRFKTAAFKGTPQIDGFPK